MICRTILWSHHAKTGEFREIQLNNKQSDVKFWLNWRKYGAVSYWLSCTSLLQAIKKFPQCCPPSIFTRFLQGSILESLVKKKSELAKLFNVCWNHILFISVWVATFNKSWITLSIQIFFPSNFQGLILVKNPWIY